MESNGSPSLSVILTYCRSLLVIVQYLLASVLSGKVMIVPEHPITFFAELPPCPGIILERDDVPIFCQLFLAILIVQWRNVQLSGGLSSPVEIPICSYECSVVPAELQNQLPVSLQRRSSRLDPAETHSTKPKRFQDVCHPAYTHIPVVSPERVAPTALSHDPPTPSKEKSPESMVVDDSGATTQSLASVSRLTRVDPSATDTMCSPAATPLSAPIYPGQQPHPPAAVPSSSPHKSHNIAAVNPIAPQLLPNDPDSRTPIPASPTTATVMYCTEQPSWPLKRMEKAIRKQKEYVTFYRSSSGGPLDSPPDVPEAYEHPWRIADLYVHHNQTENTFQIWMRSEMKWIKVAVDTHHPTLSNYHLKLLDNGEPSWVLRKMMVTDRGRVKRKQEAFTTSKLSNI
ncbi:hypothetical protein EDD16DRAFT_1801295 [Pisolithus croceorrhizus]|nr:hypothetical protein EV401DRAFT_2142322 [Pisolithus croceorrhizus]KAI6115085.1 hypothetical protein EDD16DRAFT_1801295 [Pisolithus croceorrhizus]KAI6154429.1 hypothetical protein EDD17DRAFT_1848521 [Pisolithus thermaeus]